MSLLPNSGDPSRPLPLGGGDVVLLLLLTIGSLRLLAALARPFLANHDITDETGALSRVATVLLILVLHTAVIVGLVYLFVHRWRGASWTALGLRPARRNWYLAAGVIAFVAMVASTIINYVIQTHVIPPGPEGPTINPQFSLVAPAGFTWFGFLGMLVMVGAAVPFAEELVFRGVLYRWLRDRWGVAAGAALSALVFAVLHRVPTLIPVLFLLGVVLALVYEKSGSLWPAIVTHGVFNAITVVLLYALLAFDVPLGSASGAP